jgi:serine/threonine protein kinase
MCSKRTSASIWQKEEHEKATEWFKRETQLLAKLDHPSLPEYVDSFICYGRYYLVMNLSKEKIWKGN